ncbi:MAG: T9SS type A sorting domain-containing protein, partial [Candidatus Kryptoniota bacterium]
EQNYPNPFNPLTTINYQLQVGGFVTLKVYDVLGREVETLVSGPQAAGFHTAPFNGTKLASGVYFYQMRIDNYISTKKMLLLK